jgi:hypothetical protein
VTGGEKGVLAGAVDAKEPIADGAEKVLPGAQRCPVLQSKIRLESVSGELFAFVDGGHSVETIASDIANLEGSRIIVLDDYYVSGVDTSLFGCNRVIADRPHIVLPAVDRSEDGTEIALAVVAEPADLDIIRDLGQSS